MLYVSTRDKTCSFTAYRVLHEDRAPDGGLFVPFRIPTFTKEEIYALKENGFGGAVAQVLNLFFSSGITGWDVDFAAGRNPFRLKTMPHRLLVGELWHNPGSCYAYIERNIYNKLCGTNVEKPTDWARIAIRIAVLFGLYGELSREGINSPDIAVISGDFSMPVATWYARKMGLPLGRIICGCNENSGIWDLLHRGEYNTGAAVIHTDFPELDYPCPISAERLIYGTLGIDEALRYAQICSNGGVYDLDEESLLRLNDGFFVGVVSGKRIRSVISSVYRSNGYIIDPYTSAAYGGLQDYRSGTGESCGTLLLADDSPVLSEELLSGILCMPKEEIRMKL